MRYIGIIPSALMYGQCDGKRVSYHRYTLPYDRSMSLSNRSNARRFIFANIKQRQHLLDHGQYLDQRYGKQNLRQVPRTSTIRDVGIPQVALGKSASSSIALITDTRSRRPRSINCGANSSRTTSLITVRTFYLKILVAGLTHSLPAGEPYKVRACLMPILSSPCAKFDF